MPAPSKAASSGAPVSPDLAVVDDQVTTYGPLRLARGITRWNLSTYYWLAFSSIMIFTFVPAAQTALLTTVLSRAEGRAGRRRRRHRA